MTVKAPKKLIEVALPLDDINIASAREKSIRHGHPSTLHLWWARRPLAAARAVLFAQMVNDPGYERSLGRGVNKKEAAAERERLFEIIKKLVQWENTNNEAQLAEARAEIWKSWREVCALNKNHPQAAELFNPDKLPAFHDPFAGGGAIPLEAQRLGLESYASDLNPVAVLINKAMIEIPPKFAGRKPVGPVPNEEKQATLHEDWSGAKGLAEDVRRYGQWMREEAYKRIGHLYPPVEITSEMAQERPDLKPLVGQKLTVIAWLWARTVKSPNPAYSHVEVPLASTFMLSTREGKEAYVEPVVEGDSYRFTVKVGRPRDMERAEAGTKASGRGANFRCLMSDTPIDGKYIKAEGQAGRMRARLMAIVAERARTRVYLSPTPEMEAVAAQAIPDWKPSGDVPARLTGGTCYSYGLTEWDALFTPRQLVALTTFSDLVQEAREKVKADYLGARASRPHFRPPEAGGTPALPGMVRPQKTWHSRGYLPHWEAGEIPQSITFRLHDSLPRELLERWRGELANLGETEQQLERRKRIEAALDTGHGACFLKRPEIGALVENTLLHFDGERYRLHAWVVMPNHVHVLATPLHGNSLSSMVHSWKSFTAKEANRLLGRDGAFWLEEYFDRAMRDDRHFARAVEYIENNPVKAGLCAQAADWMFGSASLGARPSWAHEGEMRAGRPCSQDERPLDAGGTGATAYADAVAVYLAFCVDKNALTNTTLATWQTNPDRLTQAYSRQALPMTWDFAEANPLSNAGGGFGITPESVAKVLVKLPLVSEFTSNANQNDATTVELQCRVISTDPPYYDNIGYADLSDYFYVWLRHSLKSVFPGLFATLTAPKAEELVATPYRHGNKEAAEAFFMDGMTRAMHRVAEQAHPAFPVTIYYAFKQSDSSENGTASAGWETFLDAVLKAGFVITGTWPMRTELVGSLKKELNALASSVILVCRQRDPAAATISRREFLRELNAVLPEALLDMTRGGINSPVAPVDLSQAIIGPGMAIFSKYAAVLEADGMPMSVRTALQLINRFLAEDDFDADTQFCLHWFESVGWGEGKFGEADVLARAKGTSVDGVVESGVLASGKGAVRLLRYAEYPADWSPEHDTRTPVWEGLHHLIRALQNGGESASGALLAKMPARAEAIRQLAYRLYTLCERKGQAEEARAYNELITSWEAIEAASHTTGHVETQIELTF